jgi:hypothetical protein
MSTSQVQTERGSTRGRIPWNKGKLVGQKPPLKMKEVWRIRFHLQHTEDARDLALFDLAIDASYLGVEVDDALTISEQTDL